MPDRPTLIPDFFERRYLVARFGALAVLFAMVAWSVVVDHDVDRALALVGLFVFTVSTAAILLVRRAVETSDEQILLWVAGFDLVAIGLLGIAYHPYEDPAYPMLIAIPVFYAMLIRKRGVWMVGLASAATYTAIHWVAGDFTDALQTVVFMIKAVVIVIISGILADTAYRFLIREQEITLRGDAEERLNEQLQRRLAELQAVSQITEIIHSSLDFDAVGPLVLDILTKVIDVPECCLFVIDKSRAETLFSASVGVTGTRLSAAAAGAVGHDIEVADSHFTCTPIIDHKQNMVVFCAPSESIDVMSDEDNLVLQAVSSELLVAVENSQLYKLTKRLAITDELTGLYNYRYLQQRLDEEIERARRYRKDLSLLMIDADDFKHFNDTCGHIAGDRALAELGSVMRGIIREVDVVCRYGGEEFSVILPETDAAGAFVVAEKLREAVAEHVFADKDGQRRERLTVSVGVASFPSQAGDKEELLKAADDALYHAKGGGKNRVRSPRLKAPGAES